MDRTRILFAITVASFSCADDTPPTGEDPVTEPGKVVIGQDPIPINSLSYREFPDLGFESGEPLPEVSICNLMGTAGSDIVVATLVGQPTNASLTTDHPCDKYNDETQIATFKVDSVAHLGPVKSRVRVLTTEFFAQQGYEGGESFLIALTAVDDELVASAITPVGKDGQTKPQRYSQIPIDYTLLKAAFVAEIGCTTTITTDEWRAILLISREDMSACEQSHENAKLVLEKSNGPNRRE